MTKLNQRTIRVKCLSSSTDSNCPSRQREVTPCRTNGAMNRDMPPCEEGMVLLIFGAQMPR